MTNRLFDKINFFNKVAKYGDRKSFLESIAQTIQVPEQVIKDKEPQPEWPAEGIKLPEQIIEGQPPAKPVAPKKAQQVVKVPEQVITNAPQPQLPENATLSEQVIVGDPPAKKPVEIAPVNIVGKPPTTRQPTSFTRTTPAQPAAKASLQDKINALQSQAQLMDPALISSTLKGIVDQASALWTANPANFPMAAREALNPLMYDTDIKQMNTKGMQKAIKQARHLIGALLSSPQSRQLAMPLHQAISAFENMVRGYLDQSQNLTSLIPQPTDNTQRVSEQVIEGKPPTRSNPFMAKVQQKLTDLGYGSLVGQVDGILGPKTQSALNKFKADAPQYKGLLGKALYDTVLGVVK